MSAETLASFLNFLATHGDDLDTFNSGSSQARAMMDTWQLTSPEQDAILNHDVRALYDLLTATEGLDSSMFMPFGPVRAAFPGPVRFFEVTPEEEAQPTPPPGRSRSGASKTARKKAASRKTASRKSAPKKKAAKTRAAIKGARKKNQKKK